MIFQLIFKKRLEKQKLKEQKLYTEIRNLELEKSELEKKVQFEKERFERIKFLFKDKLTKNSRCLIEKTKKGSNVLSVICDDEFKVEVFDLDNSEHYKKRELVLWAQDKNKEFFIIDIQGGCSKGHGEIAVNHLIKFAKTKGKVQISGKLSIVDIKHKKRLIAFYTKMGFEIDYKLNGYGNVIKKL